MPANTAATGDFIRALVDALGPASVSVGDAIGARHQSDWSGAPAVRPLALLRPTDTQGVATALRLCDAHGVPVVPQGGMTGLAGGAMPQADAVALSLERMNTLEAVDPAAATLTLQAGVTLQAAQEAALPPACCWAWTWALAAPARSAATWRPTQAATGCCSSA